MATVITIPGAFSTYNTSNFQGTLFASPNTRIAGPGGLESNWRQNNIGNTAATNDMNDLDTLIGDHIDDVPGQRLIVAGHSRGGQIIYKWLREKGPTSAHDPDKLLFISSGNPERKYNGACSVDSANHTATYPGDQPYGNGYGTPATTDYTVLDIARQYDEWADHPHTDDSTPARALTETLDVHSAYSAVAELGLNGYPTNLNDGWSYYVEGNITYYLWSYFPYPDTPAQPAYTFRQRLFRRARRQADKQYGYLDLVTRAPMEMSWRRPMGIQLPGNYSQS